MSDYISRETAVRAIDVPNVYHGIIAPLQQILCDIPAADVVERPRWIPVAERLPSPEVEVLVYTEDQRVGIDKFFGVLFSLPTFSKKGAKRVTHWMPLPPAPEETTL